MFKDVNSMQKEIETFRKNMLASTELVEGIEKLIEENQNSQELVERIANQYQKEIRDLATDAIENVENNEQATIEQIKLLSENAISDVVLEIHVANSPYIDKMNQTCSEVEKAQLEINNTIGAVQKIANQYQKEISNLATDVIENVEKREQATIEQIKLLSENAVSGVVSEINVANSPFIEKMDRTSSEIEKAQLEINNAIGAVKKACSEAVAEIKANGEKNISEVICNINETNTELSEGIEKLIEENQNSQELVERIAIQSQKEISNLAKETIENVEKREQATIEQIKTISEKAISDVVSEINVANSPYIEKMNQTSSEVEKAQLEINNAIGAIEKTCSEAIAEIKSMGEKNISDVIRSIHEANKEYIDKLNAVDMELRNMEYSLTGKYDEFVQKLENAKMEDVVRICSDLKKSAENKLLIAIAGVGIAVVLEIIQFFIK